MPYPDPAERLATAPTFRPMLWPYTNDGSIRMTVLRSIQLFMRLPAGLLSVFVALLTSSVPLTAQAQEAVVHSWQRVYYAPLDGSASLLFVERFDRAKPALADMDGDGDLDMLLGRGDGRIMYFENRGSPKALGWHLVNTSISAQMDRDAKAASQPIDVGENAAPTAVDIDGDGDLDLFVGSASGAVHFYRNEGNRFLPNLRLVTQNYLGTDLGLNTVVKFPDLNADGVPDLSIGNEAGEYFIALNLGSRSSARFCLQAETSPDCLSALVKLGQLKPEDNAVPEWSDWDRDGDLDLFVGKSDGTVMYLQNIGTRQEGAWEQVEYRFNILDSGGFAAPVFADITGDGVPDLLLAGDAEAIAFYSRRPKERQFTLWLEDKNILRVRRMGGFQTRLHVTAGDLDGDGDAEIIVGTRGGDLLLYENVGSAAEPAFQSPRAPLLPTPQRSFAAPTMADVDGDGDLDLIVGGREGRLEWIENTGNARGAQWSARSLFYGGVDVGSQSVQLFLDTDGDKDLDLLVGNSVGSVVYYENVGTPTKPNFTLRTDRLGDLRVPNSAAPAQFAWNPDAPADLVVGSQAGTLTPAGRDVAVPVAERGAFRREPAWGGGLQADSYSVPFFADLTGDKRPDLLLGTGNGSLLFWRYEGSAKPVQVAGQPPRRSNVVQGAQSTTQPADGSSGATDSAASVAPKDLLLEPIFVYESSALEKLGAGRATKPAFFDANGDGRPDLIVGTAEGQLRLYLNSGNPPDPTWQPAGVTFADYSGGRNAAPAFGDVDGDGDVDLAVGNEQGQVLYWENTGTARAPRFTARPETFAQVRAGKNAVPAFVDLDGDGRLDLMVGNLKGEIAYYVNRPGGKFDLELRRFIGLDVGVNATPTFAQLTQRDVPYLVVGSDAGQMRVFGATGTSRVRSSGWREVPSYLEGLKMLPGSHPALADIDGDGDIDLVVGSDRGPLFLFRNQVRQPGLAQAGAPAR